MVNVLQQIVVLQQDNSGGDGEGSGVVQRIINKLDKNNLKEEINEQGEPMEKYSRYGGQYRIQSKYDNHENCEL